MKRKFSRFAAVILLSASLFAASGCADVGGDETSGSTSDAERTTISTPETVGSTVLQTVTLTRNSSSVTSSSGESGIETGGTTEPPVSESSATQGTQDYPIPSDLELSVAPPSTDTLDFTDDELNAFFDDAVFVGDSISLGWRNYVMSKRGADAKFLGSAQFLVSGSLGAESALWEVSSESVHPTWQGEQMQLWNSIPLTGAKKVFIMFGLNDVGRYSDLDYGIQMAVSNYGSLIDKIRENAPDTEIYIISATYVLEGGEKGKVTSENMRKLNEALIDFCGESGYVFINFADALADGNGNLAPEYCSDGYVHQTNAAYDMWTALLKGYAAGVMNAE